MVILNLLQLWLSISVILSWVMKSKYFFPVPYIPIKPAALLATAAGTSSAGPFENYGLNVGPMFISGLFRFCNGRIEMFMGRALSDAMQRQRKERRKARKEEERKQEEILRQERKEARRIRRAERELRKQSNNATTTNNMKEKNESFNNNIHQDIIPSIDKTLQDHNESYVGHGMDDLD